MDNLGVSLGTAAPPPPEWQPNIPTDGTIELRPDPHLMDSLGGNHSLETAVADLVDNSLDAGASRIVIRFVLVDGRIRSFYVVDDGTGMTSDQIDAAMTVGAVRTYAVTELGHFGLGLKAASFSQAASLTVLSQAVDSPPVGRRWLADKAGTSFGCQIVNTGFCAAELRRPWGFVTPPSGTVVRWDDLRSFPDHDAQATARFIQNATTRIQHHLGLVFHRFLEAGTVSIGIDVEDVSIDRPGPVAEVKPLNPFAYPRPGATGYPKRLRSKIAGTDLIASCHVWPGRSQAVQFRLSSSSPERLQGLYFYRRDRLLQVGGWNDVEPGHRDLQLARVAIDVDDDLITSHALRMNAEKTRVVSDLDFSRALVAAVAEDGTTFAAYLAAARDAFKRANQRDRSRSPVVPLGRGVPPRTRKAIEQEVSYLPGHDDVDMRWRDFDEDVLFDVDRPNATIWLNNRYRRAIAGDGRANFNDAPLVKTLVFLLVENLFHGAHWGPKDKDNVDLWQSILTAAARDELG